MPFFRVASTYNSSRQIHPNTGHEYQISLRKKYHNTLGSSIKSTFCIAIVGIWYKYKGTYAEKLKVGKLS